jgi:hypothetical protein
MVKFVLTSSRTIGALLWPSLKSYYPFVHCWQMQTHVSPLHLTVIYVSRLFSYIFFHLLLPLSLRLLQLGMFNHLTIFLWFLTSEQNTTCNEPMICCMSSDTIAVSWSRMCNERGPLFSFESNVTTEVLQLRRVKNCCEHIHAGILQFFLLFYLPLLGQRRMRNRHSGCGQEFPFCALG